MTLLDLILTPPPFLPILAAALLLPFTVAGSRGRIFVLTAAPALALVRALFIEGSATDASGVFSILHASATPFSLVFCAAFTIALGCSGLYGSRYAATKELVAAYIYAAGAIGALYANDLLGLFVFWEIMAIASTYVIAAAGTTEAIGAARRYGYMHFFGGVLMMAGIAGHYASGGSHTIGAFSGQILAFTDIAGSVSALLILLGVAVNLAAPPFSAWLPDAYPSASVFGTIFLSVFTTKTAVYVAMTLFPGTEVLIYVGMIMIFYGIFMAILENDMRKILAYSIINQVGFMVTAVGIGSDLALLGAGAHAFCHIAYKSLLFMSAGSVLFATGESRCSRLGGLYKAMPCACICGIIGALAISAFPFTSGFVSKSLISSAAGKAGMLWVWLGLAAASAGVFLHAGIKFPWFVFFQKDSGKRPEDVSGEMRVAMIIVSALCILPAIPGVTQYTLYKLLPTMPDYQAYTVDHVVTQLELLIFSGAAFFLMLGWLKRTETIVLDFDWFYRKPLYIAGSHAVKWVQKAHLRYLGMLHSLSYAWRMKSEYFRCPENIFSRNWSFSDTLFWAVVLLCAVLLINLR